MIKEGGQSSQSAIYKLALVQGTDCWCKSQNSKTENLEFWCLRAGEDRLLSWVRESMNSPPSTFLFCSSPQSIGCTHPHGDGGTCIFSLLSQMLISSRSTFTDAPGHNVLPTIWASLSQSSWQHKINHHSLDPLVSVAICLSPAEIKVTAKAVQYTVYTPMTLFCRMTHEESSCHPAWFSL